MNELGYDRESTGETRKRLEKGKDRENNGREEQRNGEKNMGESSERGGLLNACEKRKKYESRKGNTKKRSTGRSRIMKE